MQDYEYRDEGGRYLCRLHHRLRCDECHYVSVLQEQNKLYREAILLAVYELGFALDETEIDRTKERILQAKLILRNANVLEEIK